jgi:uncharacterized membrane protein YhaH (DUF805 family)
MDFNAIWLNFHDTVRYHYLDFHGRVGRPQFWYFVLAYVVFAILASILQAAIWLPIGHIFGLLMILPSAGMGARRLQDVGRDGRLVWLFVILQAATQIVGIITAMAFFAAGPLGLIFAPGLTVAGIATLIIGMMLLWFWIQPGDPHENAYGPPPPMFDPASMRAV